MIPSEILIDRLEKLRHAVAASAEPWTAFSHELLDTLNAAFQTTSSFFMRVDPHARAAFDIQCRGLATDILSGIPLQPGKGLLASVLKSGTPVRWALETPPPVLTAPEESLLQPALVVIPIVIDKKVLGILGVQRSGSDFSDQDHRWLSFLVEQASLILDRVVAGQHTVDLQDQIVRSLIRAIQIKDLATHTHLRRCHTLTRHVVEDLGFPRVLCNQIALGALLHDLGKIGIEERLLQKMGPLTAEEYARVKDHPRMGFEVLQPLGFLSAASYAVYYHHEWYNGQGYPEGLCREEIPLGARVVSIVDAWDAMTSEGCHNRSQFFGSNLV